MTVRTDARWRAAVEVLDRLGARGEPVVVREGLSLLVRQGDVLARSRPMAQEPVAAREVEVARALRAAGVPCAAAVGEGQPWLVGSSVVTAWAWAETVGQATTADLGHLAGLLERQTNGGPAYDVPRFDPLTAIRSAVAHLPIGDEQGDFVRRRAVELSGGWAAIADADPAGTAIVHGDLHTDNVLLTPSGPLLTDLEVAGAGPPSFDTAPAVVMVERYGADPSVLTDFLDALGRDPREWSGFDTCLAIYELWVTAWAVGVRDSSAQLGAEAEIRVSCLRDHTCEPWHLL